MKVFGKCLPRSICLSKSSLTITNVAGGQPSIERLHAAIDRAYTQVKFPYIFHCEDDWEFFRTGFIQESFIVLNALPKASAIMLHGRSDPRGLGNIPTAQIDGIRFCHPHPSNCYKFKMLVGYYHPGLRRIADYQKLYPLTKIKSEAEVWYKLLKLGFTAAHLEIPACARIWWEQRTWFCLSSKECHHFLRKKRMCLQIMARRLLSFFRFREELIAPFKIKFLSNIQLQSINFSMRLTYPIVLRHSEEGVAVACSALPCSVAGPKATPKKKPSKKFK